MYEQEYLPDALFIGITESEFWGMNPRRLKARQKAYEKQQEAKIEMLKYETWLNGLYVAQALKSTVGNMFIKKGAKPFEYPEKPLGTVDTELDNQKQVEAFFASLEVAQRNFELTKSVDNQ